ncbi:MAG: DUF1737 domain-containing protein [Desulfovibrio sp.]|nr:DUF1737 domain-containing protein [Desulfovibrio sp.]MCA1985128.1 DUF1737 domain-containing protein [Desulfovibrio sp.]
MKYRILKASTEIELEDLVQQHLHEGWRPLGGLSIVQAEMAFSKVLKFYQAVGKDSKKDRHAMEDLLSLLDVARQRE